MTAINDLTNSRNGRLLVLERGEDQVAPSGRRTVRWLCRCDCGTEVLVARPLTTRSCGCLQREAAARMGHDYQPLAAAARLQDTPNYAAAHARVRFRRGAASAHVCVDCAGPAAEWSYDGRDPDELTAPGRGYTAGRTRRYSTKVEHYEPRCKPCHRRYDSPHVRSAAVGTDALHAPAL